MSPIGLGSTFGIASEFTNEIYDISHEANQAAYKEGGDTWTMILGIVVTLLPKVYWTHFKFPCSSNLDEIIVAYNNRKSLNFSFSNLLLDYSSCNALHCGRR